MKRILVFIICICLAMVLPADVPPQKMGVVFVPDSFVRVGFADDPVYNSIKTGCRIVMLQRRRRSSYR